ncbi:MAG: hypothetical protein GY903_23575 [Fuerstiella sp.]|nr:hypothetical protein [Fuerstiella sp.]MCP4783883.1 hypothetical protein [Fuerstiella sp.]MCP4857475.1 hypothetical protein [Fuerstiella sp.]
MTYRISLILSALLLSATIGGCSGPEPRQQSSIQKTATTLSPAADNSEWVKRLLATPADTTVTQVAASSVPPVVLLIPTEQGNSVSGIRYSLAVDQTAQLAWLQQHSGIGNQILERKGPWKLTQPDVAKLLQAATPAPTQTQ